MNTYINLVNIEKHKEEALKKAKDALGEDETEELLFDGDAFTGEVEDMNFNNGYIEYNITWRYKGDVICSTYDNIEIDLDLGAEIVTHFMKKLGKLKTVLEATK